LSQVSGVDVEGLPEKEDLTAPLAAGGPEGKA
jgi:simple sugar transport system ATP-binding protein